MTKDCEYSFDENKNMLYFHYAGLGLPIADMSGINHGLDARMTFSNEGESDEQVLRTVKKGKLRYDSKEKHFTFKCNDRMYNEDLELEEVVKYLGFNSLKINVEKEEEFLKELAKCIMEMHCSHVCPQIILSDRNPFVKYKGIIAPYQKVQLDKHLAKYSNKRSEPEEDSFRDTHILDFQ